MVSVSLPTGASPAANTPQTLSYLISVRCTGVGTCTAGGQFHDTSGGTMPFTAALSGGTWTTKSAPLPGDAAAANQDAALWDIDCPAPGTCVGGGHYLNSDGQPRYLIDTLSGGKWTGAAASLPTDAAADQKWTQEQATSIAGISCKSAGSCVATATYITKNNEILPLLAALSGGAWTVAKAPLPPDAAPVAGQASSAYLVLIKCPTPGSCLSVGSYRAADGSYQAMIDTATSR
jgi:hypothetical protein